MLATARQTPQGDSAIYARTVRVRSTISARCTINYIGEESIELDLNQSYRFVAGVLHRPQQLLYPFLFGGDRDHGKVASHWAHGLSALEIDIRRKDRRERNVMLSEPTMEKLRALKLDALATAWSKQRKLPQVAMLGFDERLGLLVDAQYLAVHNKRLERARKEAKLRLQSASLESLDTP